MARLFLITLLVLSSGPAYAEWVVVGSSENAGGYTVYVDPDTIRHKGDLVKMWHLYDFKTARTQDGNSFLSLKIQSHYDCAEERSRVFAVSSYSGHMGTGDVGFSVSSDERKWEPVTPGSVDQGLWNTACAKQ